MDLGSLTWRDVTESPPILVVPVGSCEQHGPHLPLDTDTVIASAIAAEVAERRADIVVAPAIAITASGEHHGFAGTLSIGTEAMSAVLTELVRSADWARGVVLVNGHGGNATAVRDAVTTLTAEGRRPLAWWPRIAGGDLHAGHTETSLMMAIAPEHVRSERAEAGPTPMPTFEQLRAEGVRAVSPSGVLGDPLDASAAAGRNLLDDLVSQLTSAIDAWIARHGI